MTPWKKNGGFEKLSNSPACCRERQEYPTGYTVFECRLDGNQPIAQVVQVPPDTANTTSPMENKTCMLLETKQSDFGPSSRVAAYPAQQNPGSTSNRHEVTGPMSFALETRNCPGGAAACVGKVAEILNEQSSAHSVSQPLTILETTKGPTCQCGPSSRLMYSLGDTGNSLGTYKKPAALYIQCTSTSEGPIARVTQVPGDVGNCLNGPGTKYNASVKHDGSCPTAKVTQCDKRDELGSQQACEYLEAKVDSSGPRAEALNLPQGSSNVRHYTHLDVRHKDNGTSARISQQLGDIKGIANWKSDDEKMKPNLCSCDSVTAKPIISMQSPRKCVYNSKTIKIGNEVQPKMEKRNGLSPICRKRLETCLPCVATCQCPKKSYCKVPQHPYSQMHPLPGGSVFAQCPASSLPEISPVPLGPNRIRDYKTSRPKTSGSRNVPAASPVRPKQLPIPVARTSRKPTKSTVKNKATTRNKKTGTKKTNKESSGQSLNSSDDAKDKDKSSDSVETVYVECPAFASKCNQTNPVYKEPSYINCPAFPPERTEINCACKKPSYIECPAFLSEKIQSNPVSKESSGVECSGCEAKRIKSVCCSKEASYVMCPALIASKKSSEACSMYVPREEDMRCEYFQPNMPESFLSCRAKRNGFQDERHLPIPESVLRMNYEQRGNRHARTLISSTRRRQKFQDEFNEDPERRYCVRAEVSVR